MESRLEVSMCDNGLQSVYSIILFFTNQTNVNSNKMRTPHTVFCIEDG